MATWREHDVAIRAGTCIFDVIKMKIFDVVKMKIFDVVKAKTSDVVKVKMFMV